MTTRTPTVLTLVGLLAVLSIGVTPVITANELARVHLRCEYLEDPLGIEATKPRLSWIITSDQRAQKQTTYQLLVERR